MKMKSLKSLGLVAALCGVLGSSSTYAQEQKDEKEPRATPEAKTEKKKIISVKVLGGQHWIGVFPMPIDDALKSQLNLKDRLAVNHVFPDSPAAKAGVKMHDIILKFGDREIATVDDLVQAVAANSDKDANLVVLRGGKETTLTIKPGERPDEEALQEFVPKHDPEALRKWLGEYSRGGKDDAIVWRGLGPGLWSQFVTQAPLPFPKGWSVSVSKEGDKPAQIVAKKDDKSYEASEDELDELPEEIRGPIARLFETPAAMMLHPGPGGKPSLGTFNFNHQFKADKLKELHRAKEAMEKHLREQTSGDYDRKQSLKRFEIRKVEPGTLDDLRKEVEDLRKDVERLKQGSDAKTQPDSEKSDQDKESDQDQ